MDGQLEALSYIGINSREAWEVSAHIHDHFELCYIDEGRGWFAVDGRLMQVSAGDVFVTKPGEIHQGAASGDRPYRLYYAGFRLNGMPGLEDDYYRLGRSRVVTDGDGIAKALFDQLFRELMEPQPHGALVARSCFVQLLVQVIRIYTRQSPDRESRSAVGMPPVVKELLEELHALEGGRSGIDALAQRHHVSRTHLEREFKRCLGLPLGRYMRELLVERAKYWLRQPGHTATEIAERLGFSGLHAFSVFFKRHTGMAPADFRKSALQATTSTQ
ncbi:AraC family transcriptional regulator [Paenibacillus sp. 598K]|uniref:AraC family transcriptional regulator n=1 Tax=Paenibacillus sp. 598K TaxID=1117987 RepID=UPI000FF9FBAC|nr:helix-turn-helix transcriptional regulator [Paenibacillus sp. 598K]GBF78307.1 AraC family transcriptional regulator [Paenibacillus sp. 598K]